MRPVSDRTGEPALPSTILIADLSDALSIGLEQIAREIPGIRVVGRANSPEMVLRLVAKHSPNLLLIDIRLLLDYRTDFSPDQNPTARSIVLVDPRNGTALQASLAVCAWGYLSRDSPRQSIAEAIRAVRSGRRFLDPVLGEGVLAGLNPPATTQNGRLTPRQVQVLQLVSQGLSNRQIGVRLGLSEKTVGNYVSAILRRLRAGNRTEAVMRAQESGLV